MAAALTQANGIDVRTVLSNCRVIGAADRRFATCCSDPHACRPGDLFVALLGDESDGHDQAHDAVAAGAVGVVTERMLPVGVTQFVVDDTRQAYGRL
ncbi:MAG: hypothetical protein KDA41_22500, partial [Planctomycetales bacterium]|nr:hypothetical protein [Planctomycetales bacterium]